MDAYDLVLAVVANEPAGRVLGRTLLQKKLFFLNQLISGPVQFMSHYYGPYSRGVAETVDSLVSAGMLVERVESFPALDTCWGDSTRYSYELQKDKSKVVSSIISNRMGADSYSLVSNALKRINDRPEATDYRALSVAAKVFQILLERNRPMYVKEFPKEAGKLNWKLSTKDVKNATEFLTGIGLLEVRRKKENRKTKK